MEHEKIKYLIEKYFEAQTSTEEEIVLKDYFTSCENIPKEFETAAEIFKFSDKELNIKHYAKNKKSPKTNYKWVWSVAASLLIVFSVGWYVFEQQKQQREIELAYAETQKALLMVSEHLNIGVKKMTYLTEFNATTEIIFKQQ